MSGHAARKTLDLQAESSSANCIRDRSNRGAILERFPVALFQRVAQQLQRQRLLQDDGLVFRSLSTRRGAPCREHPTSGSTGSWVSQPRSRCRGAGRRRPAARHRRRPRRAQTWRPVSARPDAQTSQVPHPLTRWLRRSRYSTISTQKSASSSTTRMFIARSQRAPPWLLGGFTPRLRQNLTHPLIGI